MKNNKKKIMPGKSKKTTKVKPLLSKGSNTRKFLDTAVSVIGGPAVMAYKGLKNVQKKRKASGMVKKRGGLIQHD